MRSAGLILLQTVPEGLGACQLRAAALKVPGVLAIHELHVWQLHRDRVVATAHIAYSSHEVSKIHFAGSAKNTLSQNIGQLKS